MNTEECLELIQNELSSKIQSCKEIHQGTFNVVFEINGCWIFRFSRERKYLQQLEIEKQFLHDFLQFTSIEIPHIEYAGHNFIGYKKIEGVPLTKERVAALDEQQRVAVWKSVGTFLTKLHSSRFTHKNLCAFPYGGQDFWNDLWEPTKNLLSKKAMERANEYFASYFQETRSEKIEAAVCHGDLHPNHILFDTSSGSISGIIDFGNMCLNDPAMDFNLFERMYGDEALASILEFYDRATEPSFTKRISFQSRRRLFDAVYRARTLDYAQEIPRYIQRIEDAFA